MSAILDLGESRYDRQERITWWDQQRLADARVVVVGAGALGNEAVKNLALLGVGSLLVIDLDVVETSNLSRCVFFRDGDDGRSKASVVAERASELNPEISVTGWTCDVMSIGAGMFKRADVVVGALDNREARLHLNRLAWRVGVPWIDGAMEALLGVARVFRPPDSCYECTLSEADWAAISHRQSCRLLTREEMLTGKVPTTATTASIVSGLLAQEVVKMLHGDRAGVHCLEGAIIVDGSNNDAYPLTYPFDTDCLAHDTHVDTLPLTVDDDTRFSDIFRSVGWADGLVELSGDHLTAWRCTSCKKTHEARGSIRTQNEFTAACPECGASRIPVITTAVSADSDLATERIQPFDLRTDEILRLRGPQGERSVWLQDAGLYPQEWR